MRRRVTSLALAATLVFGGACTSELDAPGQIVPTETPTPPATPGPVGTVTP